MEAFGDYVAVIDRLLEVDGVDAQCRSTVCCDRPIIRMYKVCQTINRHLIDDDFIVQCDHLRSLVIEFNFLGDDSSVACDHLCRLVVPRCTGQPCVVELMRSIGCSNSTVSMRNVATRFVVLDRVECTAHMWFSNSTHSW